ncbi:MAG: Holliday junction resolvase RuvX [Armatimonadetes bacterium]|nr:Holliday junction resolvase RuvX [Armatimonadota bacterium]MDW8121135.1 Holliday junction resolvase RuvX [Armatimonadota bacterium]
MGSAGDQEKVALPEKGPILALDYGEKRIGVSISDPDQRFAFPLKTIENHPDQVIQDIVELISRHKVVAVVIGLPIREDGTKGPEVALVEDFAKVLRERIGVPILFFDERYTTRIAQRAHQDYLPKRRSVNTIDALAAAILLEGFLEWSRQRAREERGRGESDGTMGVAGDGGESDNVHSGSL